MKYKTPQQNNEFRNKNKNLFSIFIFLPIFFSFYLIPTAYAVTTFGTVNTIPTNGLSAYWTMDGGDVTWSSATVGTSTDRSGNGKDGLLVSMNRATSLIPGKIGQAVRFDGSSQYINAPSTPFNNSSGTVSWWQKSNLDFNSGTVRGIWGTGRSDTAYVSAQIYSDNNWYVGWNTGLGFEARVVIPATAMNAPKNQWAHYTVVWNSTGTRFYMNGVLIGSSGVVPPIATLGANMFIGGMNFLQQFSIIFYYNGSIDDYRVYNSALSPSEVTALYKLGSSKLAVPDNYLASTPTGSGLVGYWSMDGTDTTWNAAGTTGTSMDKSGLGNNGVLTNMSRSTAQTTGKIGQAFTFDGVDDYIDTTDINEIEGVSRLTYSVWVLSVGSQSNYASIASKTDAAGTTGTSLSYGGPSVGSVNSYALSLRNGSNTYAYTTSNEVVQGTWQHVVAVYDGTQSVNTDRIKIYVNGVSKPLTFSGTIPITIGANSNNFTIGRDNATTGRTVNSKLDDLRIYNRALSASEIKSLYSTGAAKIGVTSSATAPSGGSGLVGQWTFDGPETLWNAAGTTGTSTDKSGNGNIGVLTSMSRSTAQTTGKIGQGLLFDGVDDYVSVPDTNSLDMQSRWTVSVWIKFSAWYTGTCRNNAIVAKDIYDVSGHYMIDAIDSGVCGAATNIHNPRFTVTFAGPASQTVTGTTNLQLNTWYHLTGQYDGANLKIYVNGVLDTSLSVGALTLGNSSGPLTIGRMNNNVGFPYWVNGKVDDVRIYNRALPQSEIYNLYKLGAK
jgi:hypothetical protein